MCIRFQYDYLVLLYVCACVRFFQNSIGIHRRILSLLNFLLLEKYSLLSTTVWWGQRETQRENRDIFIRYLYIYRERMWEFDGYDLFIQFYWTNERKVTSFKLSHRHSGDSSKPNSANFKRSPIERTVTTALFLFVRHTVSLLTVLTDLIQLLKSFWYDFTLTEWVKTVVYTFTTQPKRIKWVRPLPSPTSQCDEHIYDTLS